MFSCVSTLNMREKSGRSDGFASEKLRTPRPSVPPLVPFRKKNGRHIPVRPESRPPPSNHVDPARGQALREHLEHLSGRLRVLPSVAVPVPHRGRREGRLRPCL
mmetsp:Transcript_2360/g.9044  ORF Transcript_2360/g.9044 Transcript_2360/m.9044 type:complete len:104 (+) Transcript_2360:80-391(+)